MEGTPNRLAPTVVALLAALWTGSSTITCGADQVSDYLGFVNRYATTVCQRASECCAPADFAALYGADLVTCRQAFAADLVGARQVFASGLQRFDRAAGEACLAQVRSDACPLVFDPLPANCPDISAVGTRPLGAPCDDDLFCTSADCEGQTCVVRPAPPCDVCPSGEYCGASGCTAIVQPGNDCTSSPMCGDSGACVNSVCAGLLGDGAACTGGRDCATGTCSNIVRPGTAGTCRPTLCHGA